MLVAGRMDRRRVFLLLTALLLASNLISAFAPNFSLMLAGRALLGAALGGFWTLAHCCVRASRAAERFGARDGHHPHRRHVCDGDRRAARNVHREFRVVAARRLRGNGRSRRECADCAVPVRAVAALERRIAVARSGFAAAQAAIRAAA